MEDKEFEKLQKDVCTDIPVEEPVKELCAPCTPNKNFVEPDWRNMVEQVYLNEALCEYQICVTINKNGDSFTGGEFRDNKGFGNRTALLRSFIQPALVLMLEHLGKLIANQIICASHEGPAVFGTPNELISRYDNFESGFLNLKDDPESKMKNCPDILEFEGVFVDPTKPFDFRSTFGKLPEIKNPFALELYARAVENYIDPAQNLLKVLISIPKFIIDQAPNAPTAEGLKSAAIQTMESVEINVADMFGMFERLSFALKTYSKYQSYFYQTQDGFLTFKKSKKDFYASRYSSMIEDFRKDLIDLGKANRFNLRSIIPSLTKKNADQVKITFKKEGDNPYVIQKIEAKTAGCPYQKLTKESKKFKDKWSNKPTLMNYIAKIKEIDLALTARESYPWIDFLVKFTYPLLTVNYGNLNNEAVEESAGKCVANNAKDFEINLKDYILNESLNLLEAMAYEFNSKSNCADILAEEEIEKKFFEKDPGIGLKAIKKEEAKNKETFQVEKEKQISDLNQQIMDKELEIRFKEEQVKKLESWIENSPSGKKLQELRNEFEGFNNDVEIKILKDQITSLEIWIKNNPNLVTNKHQEKLQQLKDELEFFNNDVEIKILKDQITSLEAWIENSEHGKKLQELQNELDLLKKELENLKQSLQSVENKEIQSLKRKEKREIAKKARQDRRSNHPYYKKAKELALEEIGKSDSVLQQILGTTLEEGTTDALSGQLADEEITKFTLCNVKTLTVQALRCLFSGISQEIAFKKMAESALKAMNVDVLGIFISYLPPAEQEKLRKMATKEWKDMLMPWEPEYKAGGSKEANPYLTYLGTNKKDLDVAGRKESLEQEIVETKRFLSTTNFMLDTDKEQYKNNALELQNYSGSDFENKLKETFDKNAELNISISSREQEVKDLEALIPQLEKQLSELGTDFLSLPKERQEEIIASQKEAQGSFGSAFGNIQEQIIDAYIKNIIDVVQIDKLMTVLDKFPGGQLVTRYINKVNCSHQGMFNPPIKSFLSTLSLDVCGEDFNVGLSFPSKIKDFQIPKIWSKNFLTTLRNQFIDKIETILTQVIKMLLVKLIQSIEGGICKGLNALAQGITGIAMDEAMQDAFCPEGDKDDLRNTQNNLMNNALGTSNNPMNFDCLFETLNSTLSKQEAINLLTNTPANMDSNVINRTSELVRARCPELASYLGDPEDLKSAFGNISKFIPPELRDFLRNEANRQPQGPIYDSICLTQEELVNWNRDRINLYTDRGLDPETAQRMVDQANDRALKDLGNVADIIQKGPTGMLEDALAAVLAQKDPGCLTDPSAIILETADMAADKLEQLDTFFRQIEAKFIDDLIGEKHSILNNILIDSNGVHFKRHENLNNLQLLFPNYVDSDDQWERRKEALGPLQFDTPFGGFPYNENLKKGMFPETVGIRLLDQIKEMDLKFKATEKYSYITMKFEDKEEVDYSSTLTYRNQKRRTPSHFVKVDETFYSKPSRKEAKALGIDRKDFDGKLVKENSTEIQVKFDLEKEYDFDHTTDDNTIELQMFREFIKEKSKTRALMSKEKSMHLFENINNKILDFLKKNITEDQNGDTPIGFKFGADGQEKITFKDMLYVNPEADPNDMTTWVYTKLPSEKVLGKSATEHPRVHYLDPAIHGGSYLFPKVYIEPATYNGWLGMVKTFIPELQVCDDVDNGFLNINQISRRVKKVENSLPIDPRLSYDPECVLELPYDRQLTPANHGLIEGITLATIRVFTTEFMIKTLPVFGSLEYNSKNIDETLFIMMAQKFQQEMTLLDDGFGIVKGYPYFLLFLEQAVQVAQRQIKDGLLEETEQIKKAKRALQKAQNSFERFTEDSKTALEQLYKGSAIIGYGLEWEDYYNSRDVGSIKIIRMLTPDRISIARKIAVIEETKEHAYVFLAALISREMSTLSLKINSNLRPRPHIHDVLKYLISKHGIAQFSSLRSGEVSIEVETIEGGNKPSYGDVVDCSNLDNKTPLRNLTNLEEHKKNGTFFVEKYIKRIDKNGDIQILSIDEMKRELRTLSLSNPDAKISDLFGDARIVANSIVGSIGLKMGVRLVYCPPKGTINFNEVNINWDKERAGFIGNVNINGEVIEVIHIPMVSFEQDLKDRKMKDFNLSSVTLGEELKCYVDKMVMDKDFILLFSTIFKTKTFASLFGIYSFYNFFESIGVVEIEEDKQDNINHKWKRKIFDETKVLLRNQFRSVYRSDDDEKKDGQRRAKQDYSKFIKNLLPDAYLGLDSSVMWFQTLRLLDYNPFDIDGEECLSDFQKLFRRK